MGSITIKVVIERHQSRQMAFGRTFSLWPSPAGLTPILIIAYDTVGECYGNSMTEHDLCVMTEFSNQFDVMYS